MKLVKDKFSLTRQVWKKDNVIVITTDGKDFGYHFVGDNAMFSQLYHKLVRYIPDWYYKWRKNKLKDEAD